MKDFLLILAVIPFFALAYYFMNKMTDLLSNNGKRNRKEIKAKGPSFIILSGKMPQSKIDEEIDKYRKSRHDFDVIIKPCSSEDKTG